MDFTQSSNPKFRLDGLGSVVLTDGHKTGRHRVRSAISHLQSRLRLQLAPEPNFAQPITVASPESGAGDWRYNYEVHFSQLELF